MTSTSMSLSRTARAATRAAKGVMPLPNRASTAPERLEARQIALAPSARALAVEGLNQVLADTMCLRDLYKKHHWQVAGPTFYQLHLLYDKHFLEQAAMVDAIAERIQLLGGTAIAMAADVAEATVIARPPREAEPAAAQLARLAEAHERIIREIRSAAKVTDAAGDAGTGDLLVGTVLRTNEMQQWFITQHIASTPGDDE